MPPGIGVRDLPYPSVAVPILPSVLLSVGPTEPYDQGFKLTTDDEPSRFSDGVQMVKFEITEGYTREKHELT